jgi:hypothetical protein
MPDTDVYCGGLVPPPGHQGPTLLLDAGAKDGAPAKVTLAIDHITRRMAQDLPDRLIDLLEIAAYVYCADQFSKRDTPQMHAMGAAWRRRFRFHIPVRDSAVWSRQEVAESLADCLGFLSEDQFDFAFTASDRSNGLEPYLQFQGEGAPAGFDPDRIVLFSGGLDSFAGAAEALLHKSERIALISHQSSKFVRSKQTELIDALRRRLPSGRIFDVSVGVSRGALEAKEYTQRSRSFLFATLGFVLGRLFRKNEVTFFENGIVSLNLPISEHVLGARATRTTHPQVLAGLNRLFSLLADEPIRVVNPYFWQTKAEVVKRIEEVGCGDLIEKTFSCARIREATRLSRHCGLCSQCIDRRFGILAAGLRGREPADLYAVDLFTGARTPGPDVTLAESYVLTAAKFAKASETTFLERYGQVFRALPFLDGLQPTNAARLHQLHVRHGRAVTSVVDEQLASHASLEHILGLPPTCLIALIQAPTISMPAFTDAADESPSVSEQARLLPPALQRPIRLGVDQVNGRILFAGGPVLTGKSFTLIEALLVQFLEDQAANLWPADYRHRSADKLAAALGVEEQGLRQLISRVRSRLRAEFRDHCGGSIADDDVVQNTRWKGYRLNPYLVIQPVALIEAPAPSVAAECHSSPARMSQLDPGAG